MSELIPRRSRTELERLRNGVRRLFPLFRDVGARTIQGMTASQLDRMVGRYLQKHGLVSAMLGYRGFPANCAVSVNAVAAHGVPDSRPIQRGDLFSLDVAASGGGWVTDTAWTYLMPGSSRRAEQFYRRSWTTFRELLVSIRPGMTLYDLAYRSQEVANSAGLAVIPQFVGHGIGRTLHEQPVIPFTLQATDSSSTAVVLQEGSTINIEPIYSDGAATVQQDEDGWSYRTTDGAVTAHFELTVLLDSECVEVLQFEGCAPEDLPVEPPFGVLSG